MNFCQFFNRSMKKIVYGHTWIPTESINVPIGILILLGTVLECVTIRPIDFLINKLPTLSKIKISYAELMISAFTIAIAWILALIIRDFFIQPISTSWLAYGFGILLLNVLYMGELLMFTVYNSNKNYEKSVQIFITGFKPYIIIGKILNHLYNKTSSSCPLKKE